MFNKITAALVSVAMLLGLAAVLPKEITQELGFGIEANADTYGFFEYDSVGGNAVKITGYNGTATEIEIPSVINSKDVTSIGDWAVSNHSSLVTVEIPNSVTYIGEYAFDYCTGLKTVILSKNLTSIGSSAFYNCESLENIELPSSLKGIGSSAFYKCQSLKEVIIPDGVVSIGSWAFENCLGLLSISIPDSVTTIGNGAFSGCSGFTIYCGSGSAAEQYAKDNNIPYEVIVDGFSVTELSDSTVEIKKYNGKAADVTVPNSLGGKTVTSIGDYAFYSCKSVTSITVPNSVIKIGNGAFCNCTGLASITIPNSVKSIGHSAFDSCKSLTGITLPNSIKSIGENEFLLCTSLTSITIPNSVASIDDWAFYGCKGLTSITIPNSVTYISDAAFDECGNVTISCSSTSYACSYAKKKGIDYKLLDNTNISDCKTTLAYTAITYNANGISADKYLTVKDGSKTLVNGVDYETSYTNNKTIGYQTCTLTIKGKGSYTGTVTRKLTIKPSKLAAPALTTGKATVTANWNKPASKALAYQIIYDTVPDFNTSSNGHTANYHSHTVTDLDTLSKVLPAQNFWPGETWYVKVRAFITDDGTVNGTRYGTFSSASKIVVKGTLKSVSIPRSSYTYTGKAIKPELTVKDTRGIHIFSTNYTAAYSNNTEVGKATITIKGKSDYLGTVTKTFVITPKAGTLTLTAGTASFKASCTKDTAASGYQFTYSKDKDFSSGVYNYSVSKNTTTSVNFSSKPQSGETWYVKYRPFVTIDGKKYYGSYSSVKSVTTK